MWGVRRGDFYEEYAVRLSMKGGDPAEGMTMTPPAEEAVTHNAAWAGAWPLSASLGGWSV